MIPDGPMEFTVERQHWRRWLCTAYRETFHHSHRPLAETHQLVRRTGVWEGLAADVIHRCGQCAVCLQLRS